MNPEFKKVVESLEPSFQRLINMSPVSIATLPNDIPKSGIYLFSEGATHFYVGRSNKLRERLQSHCRPSSDHFSATFAFRLAQQLTGIKTVKYSPDGSREKLQKNPEFATAFEDQKSRIRQMDIRYVSEPDPIRQTILEVYAAVTLRTEHNNFDNH